MKINEKISIPTTITYCDYCGQSNLLRDGHRVMPCYICGNDECDVCGIFHGNSIYNSKLDCDFPGLICHKCWNIGKDIRKQIVTIRSNASFYEEKLIESWKLLIIPPKKHNENSADDYFWDIIKDLGWGTKSIDFNEIKKQLIQKYSADAESLETFVREKREILIRRLDNFADRTYWRLSDNRFWDLTAHIVGEGKEKYYQVLFNPTIAKVMSDARTYTENFQYIFDYKKNNMYI